MSVSLDDFQKHELKQNRSEFLFNQLALECHQISNNLTAKSAALLQQFSKSWQRPATMSGYRAADKRYARQAVDELVLLQRTTGCLQQDMIRTNPLIEDVMLRYGMRDIDELNEWLEQF